MMKYKTLELPYEISSENYFQLIKHQDWPVFLNSNQNEYTEQRYDIISCNPFEKILVDQKGPWITTSNSTSKLTGNPMLVLQDVMSKYKCDYNSEIPFCGGAIGFMSYDLGKLFQGINIGKDDILFPLMAFGIYDWALIHDHQIKKAYVVYHDWNEIISNLKLFSTKHREKTERPIFKMISSCESNMNYDIYKSKLNKILDYIKKGDCYQVNFSQRFSLGYSGDEFELYMNLNEKFAAPYSSFISYPFGKILSFSPERFLSVTNKVVETKPIKGTRRRSHNYKEDNENIRQLKNSSKDRAENLMIVDLLRNDLSMNCKLGSIKVEKLFEIETFANVHHLVSTIKGEIDDQSNIYSLIKDAFPGGSITGAPKIRSMEIIEELELSNRSVYCGSIGYISFDETVDLNISIRTMLGIENQLYFWGGGGIVNDSDIKSEYYETLDKVKPLLDTFSD